MQTQITVAVSEVLPLADASELWLLSTLPIRDPVHEAEGQCRSKWQETIRRDLPGLQPEQIRLGQPDAHLHAKEILSALEGNFLRPLADSPAVHQGQS